MKINLTYLSFILCLLFSCSKTPNLQQWEKTLPKENFQNIDPSDFNQKIQKIGTIENAQSLMELYYPARVDENAEGNQSIEITVNDLDDNVQKVTLLHDRMLDDSQRAQKIIMIVQREKNNWTVHLIKKNWKCWPQRGHEDWGIELCH